jgi:hypothetical protein
MLEPKAGIVMFALGAVTSGVTSVSESDIPSGTPSWSGLITVEVNDETPPGELAEMVKLVPKPKSVAPAGPIPPVNIPDR